MPEQSHAIGRLAYEESTHAPVFEQYRAGTGDFVAVGDEPEPGKPWRVDPDTGAEIHALGGPKGKFSTGLKVGSYYPATTFVFANRADGEHASHEELEEFLREHDLWSDALSPIMSTEDVTGGPHLRPGFMYRPPGRAPYDLDGIKQKIENRFDLEDHDVLGGDRGFQAMLG